MGLKSYKPTSAGRRLMTVSDFAEITKSKPEKKLTKAIRKTGGRNVGRRPNWKKAFVTLKDGETIALFEGT